MADNPIATTKYSKAPGAHINTFDRGSYTDNGDGTPAKQTFDLRVKEGSSISNTLKFWEMKGLTLTNIEDTYNFDFVVTGDCIPVVVNGQFVVVER